MKFVEHFKKLNDYIFPTEKNLELNSENCFKILHKFCQMGFNISVGNTLDKKFVCHVESPEGKLFIQKGEDVEDAIILAVYKAFDFTMNNIPSKDDELKPYKEVNNGKHESQESSEKSSKESGKEEKEVVASKGKRGRPSRK